MALYASALFMIVPTLFEAVSFPVLEAFANGLPVACSNVTSLPEQVGDAALLFDPVDVGQIVWAEVTPAAVSELGLSNGVDVTCLVKTHSLRLVD